MSASEGNEGKDFGESNSADDLLKDFMAWQEHTMKLASETHALNDCISEKDKLLKQSEDRYFALKLELKTLQDVVTKLQDILAKRCDFEDQNIALSAEIAELREQMAGKEKVHQAEILELKRNAEDMQLAHLAEMADREEMCKKKAAEEKAELTKKMKATKQQVENLEQQLASQERDRQAQLVKLRLEYDSKLLKVQNQSVKNQQHMAQGVNQDIFRKKLQHQKDEYEREVSALKRRLSDYEQRQGGAKSEGSPAMCKRRKVNFHRS